MALLNFEVGTYLLGVADSPFIIDKNDAQQISMVLADDTSAATIQGNKVEIQL